VPALYTIVRPAAGIDGPTFGVVADDSGARYVFEDGSGSWAGLDEDRIQGVAELSEIPVQDASSWLGVACSNLGYVVIAPPQAAADIDAATTAVQEQLAAQ
jgi:hypothetical protein